MFIDPELQPIDQEIELDDIEYTGQHRRIGRTLLLAGLLCALVVYLLILFMLGDPLFTGLSHSKGRAAPSLPITRLSRLDFSPVELEEITDQNQLLEAIILSAASPFEPSPRYLYLRVDSFERFTSDAMTSDMSDSPTRSWPAFAFEGLPENHTSKARLMRLTFFKNFEARLPYPPELIDLGGPLAYCSMLNGSLLFDETIAIGDEFEIKYAPAGQLVDSDLIAQVASDSPYLAAGALECSELSELAAEVASQSTGTQKVMQIKNFIETKATYKADFKRMTREHPVKEFLTMSMQGHCQHFAASMVILCRLNGIPARVAGGFYTELAKDDQLVVLGGMAHAWAEVLTESGWKTVDIAAARSETEQRLRAAKVKCPGKNELQNHLKKRQKAVAELISSGGVRRQPAAKTYSGPQSESRAPGTLIPDRKRHEEHLRQRNEQTKRAELMQNEAFKQKVFAVLRFIAALLLILLLIHQIVKNYAQLLRWLFKQLKPAAEKPINRPENSEKLQELLQNLEAGANLSGVDLGELFASFTELMSSKGMARGEHETANEYFARLCVTLNIKTSEGKQAATLLEGELYGGRQYSRQSMEQFLATLRQLVKRVH